MCIWIGGVGIRDGWDVDEEGIGVGVTGQSW